MRSSSIRRGSGERAPLGAPTTGTFAARDAADVFDGATAVDEQSQQLRESRLVIRAPDGLGRRIDRDGCRNVEYDRRADARDAAVEIASDDAARVAQRYGPCDERRQREHDAPSHWRDALIRLVREVATGCTKDRLSVGT